MAIRADELTLRDLIEKRFARVATEERADVADLVLPGKVVPRHCNRVKEAAAIRTRRMRLQLPIPGDKLRVTCLRLTYPSRPCAQMVGTVIGAATALAPSLMSVPTLVELGQGLLHTTTPTLLLHVVRLDN